MLAYSGRRANWPNGSTRFLRTPHTLSQKCAVGLKLASILPLLTLTRRQEEELEQMREIRNLPAQSQEAEGAAPAGKCDRENTEKGRGTREADGDDNDDDLPFHVKDEAE